jgi:V8-like Glu-specific endopeptidase
MKKIVISLLLLAMPISPAHAIYGGQVAENDPKVLGFTVSANATDTFCSGALISSNIAVSAAHCFVNKKDVWATIPGQKALKNIKVDKIITVNNYKFAWNPEKNEYSAVIDDIAFLTFKEDVVLNYNVEIANKNDIDLLKTNKTDIYIYGYGRTIYQGTGGTPNVLKTIPKDKNQPWEFTILPSEDKVLMFKETLKAGVCTGDSGGPIYSNNKLVSVINTGNACGPTEVDTGGMSTLIYNYMYLVSDIIKSTKPVLTTQATSAKIENSVTCLRNRSKIIITRTNAKCPRGWVKQ